MKSSQESRAIGKPEPNLPFDTLILEGFRLRNGAGLTSIKELDVQSSGVAVCKIFTVRRNRAADHRVLAGIDCELT